MAKQMNNKAASLPPTKKWGGRAAANPRNPKISATVPEWDSPYRMPAATRKSAYKGNGHNADPHAYGGVKALVKLSKAQREYNQMGGRGFWSLFLERRSSIISKRLRSRFIGQTTKNSDYS